MMNLDKTLTKHLISKNSLTALIFLILGLAGFIDSSYLTANHYLGTALNCPILGGCETVTTSSYSKIFGAPVSLLGNIYYLAVIILAVAFWDSKKRKLLYFISYLSGAGFLASLAFTYLQFFVIKALCFYCLMSAGISTLILANSVFFLKRDRHTPERKDEQNEILKSI